MKKEIKVELLKEQNESFLKSLAIENNYHDSWVKRYLDSNISLEVKWEYADYGNVVINADSNFNGGLGYSQLLSTEPMVTRWKERAEALKEEKEKLSPRVNNVGLIVEGSTNLKIDLKETLTLKIIEALDNKDYEAAKLIADIIATIKFDKE